MPTAQATPEGARFEHLAQQRSLDEALRSLRARGWEQRLAPLAQHMAAQHLVRDRGHVGAPLRHLDLAVLREALSNLLRDEWEDGCLIVRLVVEGMDPAKVAREWGVSRPALVELLREAVDELAIQYEDTAYASVGQTKRERVQARLAGVAVAKRG
jgi:hypothetical protein